MNFSQIGPKTGGILEQKDAYVATFGGKIQQPKLKGRALAIWHYRNRNSGLVATWLRAPCFREPAKRKAKTQSDRTSLVYRDRLKSVQILLSRTQAGPG